MDIGDKIALDGSAPALHRCQHCGNDEGLITSGRGPHKAGVRCTACDRHLGWLPASLFSAHNTIHDLIDEDDDFA